MISFVGHVLVLLYPIPPHPAPDHNEFNEVMFLLTLLMLTLIVTAAPSLLVEMGFPLGMPPSTVFSLFDLSMLALAVSANLLMIINRAQRV